MTIELTTGQKLQVAAILLALGLAGFLLFTNTRPVFDQTVNSWTEKHDTPIDPKAHYDKVKNPYDPKKHEDITVFASADGKVYLTEFPNDPDKHLQITFFPDKRQAGKVFMYYPDPMLGVAAIKDPFRHSLAYAVYMKLYDPAAFTKSGGSMLAKVQPGLTADQLTKEKAARDIMDAANGSTDRLVAAGTFHPELIDTLAKTLKDFQANTKDITQDAAKRDQAHKILSLASAFQKKIYEEKDIAIDAYLTAMETIMQDDQKESLIAVAEGRVQKTAATAPAGRRGMRGVTTPNRGRAGTTLAPRGTPPNRAGRAGPATQ